MEIGGGEVTLSDEFGFPEKLFVPTELGPYKDYFHNDDKWPIVEAYDDLMDLRFLKGDEGKNYVLVGVYKLVAIKRACFEVNLKPTKKQNEHGDDIK